MLPSKFSKGFHKFLLSKVFVDTDEMKKMYANGIDFQSVTKVAKSCAIKGKV
jgi:hypothetical protein